MGDAQRAAGVGDAIAGDSREEPWHGVEGSCVLDSLSTPVCIGDSSDRSIEVRNQPANRARGKGAFSSQPLLLYAAYVALVAGLLPRLSRVW